MRNTILYLLLLASITISEQDLYQGYYSYRMSLYNVNPAFAGADSSMIGNLVTRSYLSGYDGNPRNNLLGVHGSINDKIGLGAKLMSDTKGEFEVSRYDILASYNIKIKQGITVRFGISAGLVRRSLIAGISEISDQNDPILAGGYFDETNFIAGAGILINANNLKFGFSAPNLTESTNTNELNPSAASYLVSSFSYRHNLAFKNLFITPSIIYQNIPTLNNQLDLYVKLDRKDKLWALIGYQTSNIITFGGGISLGPLDIGYLHGLPSGQLNDISASLNEIMLQIRFDRLKK